MGKTVEKAFRSLVERRLEEVAGTTELCLMYLRKLRDGFFEESYVDALFQQCERFDPFTIYDAYGFAMLHAELLAGNVVRAEIVLGEEPSPDMNIEGNDRKLRKLGKICGGLFSAKFWGGTQGEDGSLHFSKSIQMTRTRVDSSDAQIADSVTVKPGELPLEVGSVSVAKMLFYFMCRDGVARWPYHSKKIYLFCNLLGPRHVIALDELATKKD